MASSFYRALAVDFDGTLTEGGVAPAPEVLDALAAARARGLRVLLVTGRILDQLEQTWPAVHESVDCVVAENGAVLRAGHWHRLLADPVDQHLDAALSAANVPFRRGEVLLAAKVVDEPTILTAIRVLELGCQTVANRSELMVVPAGVSKGTGLYHALGHLGLSFHNTIAVGDAENDLPLYERAELAVAVSNAVEPLRELADVVLAEPDGSGVAAFIAGDVVFGKRRVHSKRWTLRLGDTPEGKPVVLPASQTNVLIAGGTGSGKSYMAGLLTEQLVEAGYSVLAVDPEGDHVGLDMMDGVLVVVDTGSTRGGTLLWVRETLERATGSGKLLGAILNKLTPQSSDYQYRYYYHQYYGHHENGRNGQKGKDGLSPKGSEAGRTRA